MAFNRFSLPGFASFARVLLRPILVAGVMACVGGSASAQGMPPTYEDLVKEGAVIADRLCSSCHMMANGRAGVTAKEGVPTFNGIANRPDQTATRIRNVLILPHDGMPDVRLSNPEIERLIAYVDSLRQESAGPTLVPRRSPGAKPQYPDPT